MRAWGPESTPAAPRRAPPSVPLPAEPPADAKQHCDGSHVLLAPDGETIIRWTRRGDGSWRKPERFGPKAAEWGAMMERLKVPDCSGDSYLDEESDAASNDAPPCTDLRDSETSSVEFVDANQADPNDTGDEQEAKLTAHGLANENGNRQVGDLVGRLFRGVGKANVAAAKPRDRVARTEMPGEPGGSSGSRAARNRVPEGLRSEAEFGGSKPSRASTGKGADRPGRAPKRESPPGDPAVAKRVAELSALGHPPEEATHQADGTFLLTLEDSSTLRWTKRPDGTWRKPEHKKAGWVGDLEQTKYVVPQVRNGLGGGGGGGGYLDDFDYCRGGGRIDPVNPYRFVGGGVGRKVHLLDPFDLELDSAADFPDLTQVSNPSGGRGKKKPDWRTAIRSAANGGYSAYSDPELTDTSMAHALSRLSVDGQRSGARDTEFSPLMNKDARCLKSGLFQ